MTDSIALKSLHDIAFFGDLSDAHIAKLADISREVEFARGDTVYREGHVGSDIFVVVSGALSVVICTASAGCRHISTAGPGELVGWSPVLRRPLVTARVQALEPTKTIAIDAQRLNRFCEEDAEFGYQLMRRIAEVLADRLSGTRLQLMDACGQHLPKYVGDTD
ncbi:MAG: cyclic nucleotide-binding domain-containing protein [Pirellulaceae bacterium]